MHMNTEVGKQAYPVEITTSGKFISHIGSKRLESDTLDGLKKQIAETQRRASASVSVPFVILPENGQARRSIAKGRHQGNGNVLHVPHDTGKTEQWDGHTYGNQLMARDMTSQEIATYYDLRNEKRAAQERYSAFAEQVRIDLGAEVDKAIAEVLG